MSDIREAALNWWNNIDYITKLKAIQLWQEDNPTSLGATWKFSMIDKSSSMIETIYKYWTWCEESAIQLEHHDYDDNNE